MKRIRVIDSHTGGEPTRVVVEGGPDLGTGPIAERLILFRDRYDGFRSAVVNEPRGSDTLVGALLCKPCQADCAAGVIFFNNVGYLGMCGHGAIGVVSTLAHLGCIKPGRHRLETPAGTIAARLEASGAVTIQNVASYRWAKGIPLKLEGYGRLTGDVAWGGNWFFLSERPRPSPVLGEHRPLARRYLEDQERTPGARHQGQGRSRDRSHRIVRSSATDRCGCQKLCPVPRGLLRPLTLRDRHLCKSRLPGRRRPFR